MSQRMYVTTEGRHWEPLPTKTKIGRLRNWFMTMVLCWDQALAGFQGNASCCVACCIVASLGIAEKAAPFFFWFLFSCFYVRLFF